MTTKVEPTVEKWEEIEKLWRYARKPPTAGGAVDMKMPKQIFIESVIDLISHSVQEAKAEERERILSDFACIGATIPKYNSQGWTHWIDEYIRKNGLDPVAIRGKYLSTLNTKEGHDK